MKKFIYGIVTINVIVIVIFAATYRFGIVKSSAIVGEKESSEKYLNIVVTSKPLYYIVKDITGDKHNVEYMFKTEQDILEYNYTEDSINNIEKKDLFFYNGANLEPWIDVFTAKLKKDKLSTVNVSRGVKLNLLDNPRKYGDKEIKENPYYLLGIEEYKIALSNIKNSIEEKDPVNRQFYEKNYEKKLKEISIVEEEMKEAIGKLNTYSIIVSSDEFDYGLNSFNLTNVRLKRFDKNISDSILKDQKAIIILEKSDSSNEDIQSTMKDNNSQIIYMEKYNGDKDYLNVIKDNMKIIKDAKNIKDVKEYTLDINDLKK
ncbi:metal ABC transporter substrate-binding protein [Clostridium algidicarnis]|uniref:metal ABC transporter substrate-binding protein n=1 Tax=Clostridium algidicarnis TaxID=37659 RepID=UPI00068C0B12|nr:metal ABC transporter substrate-binding protein [Clostridium algidicarnis]